VYEGEKEGLGRGRKICLGKVFCGVWINLRSHDGGGKVELLKRKVNPSLRRGEKGRSVKLGPQGSLFPANPFLLSQLLPETLKTHFQERVSHYQLPVHLLLEGKDKPSMKGRIKHKGLIVYKCHKRGSFWEGGRERVHGPCQ